MLLRQTISERNAIPVLDVSVLDELSRQVKPVRQALPVLSRRAMLLRQTISERNAIPVLDVSVLDELSRQVKPVRQAIPVLSRKEMLLRQVLRQAIPVRNAIPVVFDSSAQHMFVRESRDVNVSFRQMGTALSE